MTHEAIIRDLKAKKFAPVYLLHGDEPYFIDEISDFIEANTLPEAERDFNQSVIYGGGTDAITVMSTAQRYPMMSQYNVVILKEAQQMKQLVKLAPYVKQPSASSILVICHKGKTVDKRTAFYKALTKNGGVVFESKKIYDNQVAPWIKRQLDSLKYSIEPEALRLLSEYLGTNLSHIQNELNKLALSVPKGTMIDAKIIEENIGINREYNVFEFQKALANREVLKAYRIVDYFGRNPKSAPLPLLIASLYNYFQKIYIYHHHIHQSDGELQKTLGLYNKFFVQEYRTAGRNFPLAQTKRAIQWIHQYDLKSKGVNNSGTPPGELIKELTYKILN